MLKALYSRHLKLCHSMAEVNKVPAPKVRTSSLQCSPQIEPCLVILFITLNAPFLSQSMFIQQSLVKSVGKTNFSSNGPGMDFVCHSGLPKGKTNKLKSNQLEDFWMSLNCYLKVVLASMPDMECGFARELFLQVVPALCSIPEQRFTFCCQWCTNPKNSVILTSRSSPGTLARQLIAHQGDRDR